VELAHEAGEALDLQVDMSDQGLGLAVADVSTSSWPKTTSSSPSIYGA
jgi:hypothetical protein